MSKTTALQIRAALDAGILNRNQTADLANQVKSLQALVSEVNGKMNRLVSFDRKRLNAKEVDIQDSLLSASLELKRAQEKLEKYHASNDLTNY